MKLYGNENSGHAYKVALALTLSETPFEYEWVNISEPCETRPKEFQIYSRWCEVPLLLIDDQAFTQSGAILQYLAHERKILGGMKNYQPASEWIIWEANRIGMCLPQLIQAQKTPEEFSETTIKWLNSRLDIDRARLSHALSQTPYLCGEMISIADIAVFGYVYYATQKDIEFDTPINSWMTRIQQLPTFQSPDILLACRE